MSLISHHVLNFKCARGLRAAQTWYRTPLSCGTRNRAPLVAWSAVTSSPLSTAAYDVIKGLQPEPLWTFFCDLTQIPRPSEHEEKVVQYLKKFAGARKLEFRQDEAGNVVIKRAGTAGGENAPTVVVQGHIDMVCEKNANVQHDFFNDPLRLVRDGDWLKADGTTLGADNGVGVAACLALLDRPSSVKLPPLECLFTVAEEISGGGGAERISPDLVHGRTLLNLDTEDWGEVFVGCAGDGTNTIHMDLHMEPLSPGSLCFQVKVTGLLGGHSGIEINQDKGNAVRFAAQVAESAVRQIPGARLANIVGGDKFNAIPREACAEIVVPSSQAPILTSMVAAMEADLKAEFGGKEGDMGIALEPVQGTAAPSLVMSKDDSTRLLALLLALPHGPVKFSHAIPGLVETSSNLASIKLCSSPPPSSAQANTPSIIRYVIVSHTRSSLAPALDAQLTRVAVLASACGAQVQRSYGLPAWSPDMDSPVLKLVKECYASLNGGVQPAVASIHAGLECGVLGQKFPGMDMVSFGPTIKGAHSPDERVQISTVGPFWALVLSVLDKLADRK